MSNGHVPTPVTVAFSSGGGMRSKTPTRSSPSEKRLANSTARCWSSNSGFDVYPASTAAIRSCWLLLVVGRDEIFVIDAKTNWRPRWLAYGESRMERMRSMISTSVTYIPAEVLEAAESTVTQTIPVWFALHLLVHLRSKSHCIRRGSMWLRE